MVLTSPLDPVEIPETDLLTYLFPPGSAPSEDPIWLESTDPENSLSPKQLLNWVKRLAIGLDRKGVQAQEAVMILTPNHIFVPAAYLGIVGSRRIFSAANPIYTVSGIAHVSSCLPLADYHYQNYRTSLRILEQKSYSFIQVS
jgi:4-coumarate--CoA ligase